MMGTGNMNAAQTDAIPVLREFCEKEVQERTTAEVGPCKHIPSQVRTSATLPSCHYFGFDLCLSMLPALASLLFVDSSLAGSVDNAASAMQNEAVVKGIPGGSCW